ncbi:MAG: PDZ domain-containing protein [Anaerolineae bacterium]|nr:PDZ domain-containing protein [Anaerolineae bacterium]
MKKIFISLALLVIIFSSLACRTSTNLFGQPEQPQKSAQPPTTPAVQATPPTVAPQSPVVSLFTEQEALINLYERVNPGVVSIQTISQMGGAQGSGFVYDKEGHIVTNYHVVENATDLVINFSSGLKVRGKVIGNDLDSDLAVIKVDVSPEDLAPVPLGDSDKVKVGQLVVAIGNPYGLSSTMTLGIVSAKGRTLESFRETPEGGTFSAGDIIQTDASINPGNSGGPLLNLNGEVIGVNRAIRTAGVSAVGDPINTGIGFAVSVNIVRRVVPALITTGEYKYPYLGLTAREELSLIEQEQLGLPRATGAYVISVVPGGPAEKAGIRGSSFDSYTQRLGEGGDLIIAVDGRPIRVFGELLGYLMTNKSPGDKITLTVLRDNQEMDIVVTLGERP